MTAANNEGSDNNQCLNYGNNFLQSRVPGGGVCIIGKIC